MTAKWDYATSSSTGKHSEGREIYRLSTVHYDNAGGEANYGFDVVECKNKVRGSGKSLAIRFESTSGKDFELLGWSLDITGVQQ